MHDSRIGALRDASSRGVKATVAEQVVDDPERGAGIAPHQHMGLGLPMSNIFATCVRPTHTPDRPFSRSATRYLGGSLRLVSLDGWGEASLSLRSRTLPSSERAHTGTDAYLQLPRLVSGRHIRSHLSFIIALSRQGTNLEGIEV